jgi:hypothetical protein
MQKLGMLLGGLLLATIGVAGCSSSMAEETESTEQESQRDERYCIKQEIPLAEPLHWMPDASCACDRFVPGSERRDMCDYEARILTRCMGYTSCEESRLPVLRKVQKNDSRTWVYLNTESLSGSCGRVEAITQCIQKVNQEKNAFSGRFNNQPIVDAHFTRYCRARRSMCALGMSTELVFDPCPGGCITYRYPWQ